MFQHFDWDLTYQVLFLYILPSHYMNLRNQPWKMLILRCRTDICSCKFSEKVSLMLDNPFLVPSLTILNHISLCFIQISTKSPAKLLFPSGKATFFLKSSPVFWAARLRLFKCSKTIWIKKIIFLRKKYVWFLQKFCFSQ